MTDYHVHIGQYHAVYYYADRVFSALKVAGVDEAWFSSTTSCLYCEERALYEGVRGEVQDALKAAAEIGIKAHPLYWVVPAVHFAKAVTIKQAMAETAYGGFKIHPSAQKWDLQDARTMALAEEIFSYAEAHEKRILIHCGDDEFEKPALFEPLIACHPRVTVQLAHCRPLKETLEMLKKYPNTVCDSAFASEETLLAIREAGFADRIRFGKDFPITHYFSERPDHDPTTDELMAWFSSTPAQSCTPQSSPPH